MAITETAKLIIAILIGVGLLFAGQTVLKWKEDAAQNEARGRTMEATSGIIKDGAQTEVQRLVIDVGLLEGRSQFNNQLEEDNRNEPETAARAGTAVPDSRLRAFRERRLARERLGCVGAGCQQRSADSPPAER